MKALMILVVALTVVCCSGDKTHNGSIRYSPADSAMIYSRFVYYDNGVYDDVDERSIYEYGQEKPDSALYLYEQATYIPDLPVEHKMVFASYSYSKNGDDRLVREVLKAWNGKDGKFLFSIMHSYGIPFSRFDITQEQVAACCPNLEYK